MDLVEGIGPAFDHWLLSLRRFTTTVVDYPTPLLTARACKMYDRDVCKIVRMMK